MSLFSELGPASRCPVRRLKSGVMLNCAGSMLEKPCLELRVRKIL